MSGRSPGVSTAHEASTEPVGERREAEKLVNVGSGEGEGVRLAMQAKPEASVFSLTNVFSCPPPSSHGEGGHTHWLVDCGEGDGVDQASCDWSELVSGGQSLGGDGDCGQSCCPLALQPHRQSVAGGGERERVEGPLNEDDGAIQGWHHWKELGLI